MSLIKRFENGIDHRNFPDSNATRPTLVLGHGAGAPADSWFMEHLCSTLATEGVETLRFEFPYMMRRREDGRKRPPDRQPILLSHFKEIIDEVSAHRQGPLFIGGKSMGGRMASMLASDSAQQPRLNGCVCFGYPFHPPGKPDRWRIEHFERFQCPVLILQGSRDPFGRKKEADWDAVMGQSKGQIHWLDGGDHDYKPLARQPETQSLLIDEAARVAAAFMRSIG